VPAVCFWPTSRPPWLKPPNGPFIFLLGLIGFGVKVGAIPLYFWLPLAHPAAPAPASAVLSGAMIKAGLVGWMHLAPVGLVEWPSLSLLMVSLGFTAALGAAIIGLTQVDPKTNLAYSSISQMGVMTVLLGIGLYGGIPAGLLLPAIALYAFNHGTAKALLFMGTALPAKLGGSWRILMWAGLGIGVLAIAGGPLTGGLWTKYLLKTFLGETSLPGPEPFCFC
jgi:formate hydrogenlyase subunit 3/multisubunit Na+/H+ antiporter MnhD subunit